MRPLSFTIRPPNSLTNYSLTDTVTSGQTFRWLTAPTKETVSQPLSNPNTDSVYLPTRVNETPVVYKLEPEGPRLRTTIYFKNDDDDVSRTALQSTIRERLGFSFDYHESFAKLQEVDADLYEDCSRSLSLIQDKPFETMISFICSPQASIDRIYQMQRNIEIEYGEEINTREGTFYTFPTPEQLSAASEEDLRELNLGYRAPYVAKTVEKLTSGEVSLPTVRLPPVKISTSDLCEQLQEFVGVGEKVADCIALYAYHRTQIIPVDTRIQQMVEEYYGEPVETPQQAKQYLKDKWTEQNKTYAGYYQLLLYELAATKL